MFLPDDRVCVGRVTDDQDLDGLLGDLVDGASLNLKLIREILILECFKFWESRGPKRYDSFDIYLRRLKEVLT